MDDETNSNTGVTGETKEDQKTTTINETTLPETNPPAAEQPTAAQESDKESAKEPATDNADALAKIEEALKVLPPEEVQKYQRELSVSMKQNLFEGEFGKLFNKYKEPEKPSKSDEAFKNELLNKDIELALVKAGVSEDFIEEALIVARAKIKDASELSKVKDVAAKFVTLKATAPQIPDKTSIEIGEKKEDLTDGEKAVAFLRSRNPKGFR